MDEKEEIKEGGKTRGRAEGGKERLGDVSDSGEHDEVVKSERASRAEVGAFIS